MRPIYLSFSPITASLTGFASNVTGASFTITTTAPTDGLAHTVTIRNDAAVDHSGKTIVLVGTDADGKALTETVTGPGVSATVTSTKYFKTLTSATPSATIGADTFDIGWSAVSISPTIPLDHKSAAGATIAADISGTINFTGEETFEYVQSLTTLPADGVTWLAMSGMTSKTADTVSSTTVGAQGFRFKTNSVTNGATVEVAIIQPRPGS
jgi:hypothetical protein